MHLLFHNRLFYSISYFQEIAKMLSLPLAYTLLYALGIAVFLL